MSLEKLAMRIPTSIVCSYIIGLVINKINALGFITIGNIQQILIILLDTMIIAGTIIEFVVKNRN